MKRDFDLFGQPLPRNLGEVGRNEHVPTAENVSRVRQLVLAGWTTDQIAVELGISRPTLRKHYLPDIKKARRAALAEMKAKNIARLEKAADDGNVAAIKELNRIVEVEALDVPTQRQPEPPAPAKKLGKKEQAQNDALTGHEDTGWNQLLN